MSVSNAEHLEEILFEANAYGIRLEVIQLASKLQEEDNSLEKVDAHQIAFTQIKQALNELGAIDESIEKIIIKGKEIEANSNQILDFTKEVKNMDSKSKILIIETLWKIIYSNNQADMYETNLMRRLAGLLYIDSKTMGDIKHRIKEENKE